MKLKLEVTGNLGKDAELRTLENGRKVVTMSVAHTEKWTTKDGEKRDKTYWINLNWWFNGDNEVRILPYLKKGTLVSVEGMPEVNAYTSKDGEVKGSQEMTVHKLWLLGGNANTGGTPSNVPGEDAPPLPSTDQSKEDDLPF